MSDSVEVQLARIEQVAKDVEDKIDALFRLVEKQNGRIRALEVWRGRIVGGVAVGVLVVPVIWELVRRVIGGG